MNTADNPAPDLFTTYERLEVCHRVEVTEDNIHLLAKHFGWSVSYASDEPSLVRPAHEVIKVGAWIDQRGSRWNPEPLTQGWLPAGTLTTPPTTDRAADGLDGGSSDD